VTGGGEIDLLVRFGRQTAVVEVRSVNSSTGVDPLEAFDAAKARQVRKLAATLGCGRIDLVAVRFHPGGVDLHWVRRAA
jgi:Holliday junction resolvase-like predicted endonuclease